LRPLFHPWYGSWTTLALHGLKFNDCADFKNFATPVAGMSEAMIFVLAANGTDEKETALWL
jgi:hypothetical protein